MSFSALQDWNGTELLTYTVDDSQGRAVASDDVVIIVTPVHEIPFSSNWNLFSLNVEPMEAETVLEILEPVHSSLIYVFDEQFNLIRWDADAGAWSDGIGSWMGTEGYYVKLSEGSDLDIAGSTVIEMPFDIPLGAGWNIISFPTQSESGQPVDAVFEDIMGSVEMIFNWNGSLYLPGNDPFVMYPGKAYLVKVSSDATLTLNEGAERSVTQLMAQSSRTPITRDRTGHFEPVWEGTPFTPMAFVLDAAQWNYFDLEPGDEVGIFDGSLCVGAYTVPEQGFIPGAQIPTSKDDGSGNGFTEGHAVKFRVYKEDFETEIDADIFLFTDVISGNTVPQVFVAPVSYTHLTLPTILLV